MTIEVLNTNDPELTGPKDGGKSGPEVRSAPTDADPPAPAAEDQKATPTDSASTEDPQQEETPEQKEARRKARAQAHERRRLEKHIQAAADARAEANQLRQQLEAERAKAKPQDGGEPKREDFEVYEDYLRAAAKYEAKQAASETLNAERKGTEQRAQEQQRSQVSEELAKSWESREVAFRKLTPDYDEVVAPFVDAELQTIHPQARQALVESESGAAILYHLADNLAEVERIAKLSPARQTAEIGKLELKLPVNAKRTTSAPAPARPVASRASGSKDMENMSIEETRAYLKSHGARYV